ncbi:MAG: Flp pilus assembly protein CpaB [Senegalimassilia sp.]|nr:Flp pilus assembly protein CpaB [Senegalimassilia sp.]
MFLKKENADKDIAAGAAAGNRDSAEARVRSLSKVCGGLVAVAVAGAGLGAFGVATSQSTTARYTADAQQIVVATADISAGQTVSADELATMEVPASMRTSGAVAADDLSDIVGKVATLDIHKNEQLTKSMTANPNNSSKLSDELGSGKVAITISSDEENGLAGLLTKGDHVKLTTAEQTADGSWTTLTLVADCEILALGGNLGGQTDGSSASYASITVALDKQTADAVKAAQKAGGVGVTLLSGVDGAQATTFGEAM